MIIKSIEDFVSHKDDRGEIINVAQDCDVLHIYSKKGVERANHWHKTTSHLCLLIYGRMEYYERQVGTELKPAKLIIDSSALFYTGPQLEHTMYFLEPSLFICHSFGKRDQESYEKDLVRLPYSLKKIYDDWKP